MLLFTFLSLIACRDPDKLIGDSNVYEDPEEIPSGTDGEDGEDGEDDYADTDTDTDTDTETDTYTNTDMYTQYDSPNIQFDKTDIIETEISEGLDSSSLAATIEDDAVVMEHKLLQAPCEHNFEENYLLLFESQSIQIKYGYTLDNSENTCLYELRYHIYLRNAGLEPGLYKITAENDETEIDLTDYLSE